MPVENPDGTQVHMTQHFDAPPQRVWQAFTEPADMTEWMWGGYAANCVAAADLRIGGRYSVYTDSNATEHGWHTDRVGRLGVYIEIVPEQRLVYTLHWDAPVDYNQQSGVVLDEVVIVTFEDDGGGTLVDLRHIGIPDDGGSAIEHGKGTVEEFEWLARLVDR